MKNFLLLFVLLLPVILLAQQDAVSSKRYSWKNPSGKMKENIISTPLFEGSGYDMASVALSANAIVPSRKKTNLNVPDTEEHLLIVKKGMLTISMLDSTWAIGPGSVAGIMPGEKYSLQNASTDSCTFYVMKYRSKLPVDVARGKASGGSFVKDWSKIAFKPHDKGGRRDFFERSTAMCKRFEMHVTTLQEGIKSHDAHTHRAEEIVLVIDGKTEMQIGEQYYKGGAGDVYYLGSNILHAIRNDGVGTCAYFAFQFE